MKLYGKNTYFMLKCNEFYDFFYSFFMLRYDIRDIQYSLDEVSMPGRFQFYISRVVVNIKLLGASNIPGRIEYSVLNRLSMLN